MSKDVLEGNKSIAKFMGYSKIEDTSNLTCDVKELWIENKNAEPEKRILQGLPKYHCSWDLLMPVIEKLGALQLTVGDNPLQLSIRPFYEGDIVEVWKHIVEFIKWYNTQPPISNNKRK